MIKYISECVDCGLPCLYESCPYYRVPVFICEHCNEEIDEFYDNELELCEDCYKKLYPDEFESEE